jgi:hypothetical protein
VVPLEELKKHYDPNNGERANGEGGFAVAEGATAGLAGASFVEQRASVGVCNSWGSLCFELPHRALCAVCASRKYRVNTAA